MKKLFLLWMFVVARPGQAADAPPTVSRDFALGPLSGGTWLAGRVPLERPEGEPLIGDGLYGPEYYQWKNRLWTERGVSISGNLAPSIQWGSQNGTPHGVGEFLLLVDWEIWRGDNTSDLISPC